MLGMLRMVEWLQEGFGVANFSKGSGEDSDGAEPV